MLVGRLRGRGTGALVLLVAVAGVALVLLDTWRSIGLTVDGLEYVHAAESVASGHGVTVPYVGPDEPYPATPRADQRTIITHFPPLYPVVLASVVWVSALGGAHAARVVTLVLLAVFLALLAAVLARVGRDERRWVFVLLALSPDVVVAFSMAWSEPLFWVLVLGALWALLTLRRGPSTWAERVLVLVAGLAPLVRYLGLSIALAACVLVAFDQLRVRSRWRTCVQCVVAAVVPAMAWLVYVHGQVTVDSGWGLHLPQGDDWSHALSAVGGWVVGVPTSLASASPVLGVVVLVALAAAWLRWSSAVRDASGPALVCAVMGGCYLAVLVGARSVFDANIDFDGRQLTTLYLLVVVGVASLPVDGRRLARGALVALALFVGVRTTVTAADFRGSELSGFTADRWRTSPALASLRADGCGGTVLTNAPDAVQLYTSCATMKLPPARNIYADQPNDDYRAQLAELRDLASEQPMRLVFFARPTRAHGHRTIDRATADALGLELTQHLADADVYTLESSR